MRVMRYPMAVAMAAILAGTAHGQTAPTRPAAPASTPSPPSGQPAAGALNPAAEAAPAPAATAPQFDLADGIVASVNDRIITGYDLRQRMLMLILSSEIQPTQENLPAIQQAAVVAYPDDRLGERACAFVTLKPGATFDFGEMQRFLAEHRLSVPYWPERLEIRETLPATASGKIQKFVLRKMLREEAGLE